MLLIYHYLFHNLMKEKLSFSNKIFSYFLIKYTSHFKNLCPWFRIMRWARTLVTLRSPTIHDYILSNKLSSNCNQPQKIDLLYTSMSNMVPETTYSKNNLFTHFVIIFLNILTAIFFHGIQISVDRYLENIFLYFPCYII